MSTPSAAALPLPHLPAAAASTADEFHPAYRPDVDGLRAVAVLAVLAFHFFPTALPGGFVGVDIFFVISGYLITQILIGGMRQDRFRLAGFYGRRVRRLFPALLLVMAATLAFGWIALFRGEYLQLGEHAVAGAAFLANFVFWGESGYFDRAALAKPLLHLWSLGVEEQFYIFWPVLLALAWHRRWSLLRITAGIAVLSFAGNLFATAHAPAAAFYSPFTRFWELMLGAMLSCLAVERTRGAGTAWDLARRPRLATPLSLAGGALIALGFVLVREQRFPGWQALLPTAGTALLVFAGPHAGLNRRVLAWRPLVMIGLISYPLYLWHWPILSFARIVHGELGAGMRAVLLLLAVVLAGLTHVLVERPVKAHPRRGTVTAVLAALMVLVAAAGLLVMAQGGMGQRAVVQANVPLEESRITTYPPWTAPCDIVPAERKRLLQCHVDTREAPRFALLGDSKASALFPGLFRTSQPGGRWMFLGSGPDAPLVPVLSDDRIYDYVDPAAVDLALRTIERTRSVETVVVAAAARALFRLDTDRSIASLPASGNGPAALAGLDATVARLTAAGKRVVLLVDHPTLPHMEDCVGRSTASAWFNALLVASPNPACRIAVAQHRELSRPYTEVLQEVQRRHPAQVSLFDPQPVLCDAHTQLCSPTLGGPLLYGWSDHLSRHGALLVGQALNQRLQAPRTH